MFEDNDEPGKRREEFEKMPIYKKGGSFLIWPIKSLPW